MNCYTLLKIDYESNQEHKERLAELLVERDNEPCITSPQQIRPFFPDCCSPNGVCINPHRDCINCPTRGYGVISYWSVTTTNGKDNMNKEDFIKLGEDTLHCDECAFCEDCEDRFTQCVANYQHKGKPVHLKSCEYLQWNTMSEKSKAFFLQECLPHEYKRESSYRKNKEKDLTYD